MSKVLLTGDELLLGALAGAQRRIDAIVNKRKPSHGIAPGQEWQADIEGSIAEMAFGKAQRLYWCGKGVVGGKDVGGMQVRSTPYPDGHLLLHRSDADDDLFWLLAGRDLTFDVVGCITGREGKLEKYWRGNDKRPCFWVPQSALVPF